MKEAGLWICESWKPRSSTSSVIRCGLAAAAASGGAASLDSAALEGGLPGVSEAVLQAVEERVLRCGPGGRGREGRGHLPAESDSGLFGRVGLKPLGWLGVVINTGGGVLYSLAKYREQRKPKR